MERLILFCRHAFSGLPRQAWLLAAMVFINRSGAIVLPFLGVYVSGSLHYNLTQTGLILSFYGLGSVAASFLGGWLTDRFGHFKVQFLSQLLGGLLYFCFMNVQQFEYLAIGVFLLGLVNDCIRPSNATAVALYATPETLPRTFSLNRMAVNLGFVIGPAVGGLLAAISFKWLFVASGVTSIVAAIFFFVFFIHEKPHATPQSDTERVSSAAAYAPYKDHLFLIFVFLCSCFAVIFYQLFSTLPLYYQQVYQLSEENIGFLMSFNGLVILLTEMFLVFLIAKYVKKSMAVVAGVLLLGASFMLLNMVQHASILFVSMLLFSLSEIMTMPFMSSITAERSNNRNRGAYMGIFTMMYALPLVISPFLGTHIVSQYGFTTLWWTSGILATFTAAGMYFTIRQMERKKISVSLPLSLTSTADTTVGEWQPEKAC